MESATQSERIPVLVTGGAGYVGSHACKALHNAGFEPVAFDNLGRGNRWAVQWGPLVEADLADKNAISSAIREFSIQAVFHFAALNYVGESMEIPGDYFRNNVSNSLNLLDAMVETDVRTLVISSTCAVYGMPDNGPISEDSPLDPISPYGESKLMLERLAAWYAQCHGLNWTALRYFNAAGADPANDIGEWHDPEFHLIPIVVEAALGIRSEVSIFGTDYDTPDGTAVRDYIHVSDLADAHVAALRRIMSGAQGDVYNLGSGEGASVRQVIASVARVTNSLPNVVERPRRSGDAAILVADAKRALAHLEWQPKHSDLDQITATALAWRKKAEEELGGDN